jgi:prevent-host-death family protein
MREIGLRDAKARLSEVVDKAVGGEPSVITRHGRQEAVVVSFEEWQRLSRGMMNFGQFLASMPEGLEIERLPGGLRDVEF